MNNDKIFRINQGNNLERNSKLLIGNKINRAELLVRFLEIFGYLNHSQIIKLMKFKDQKELHYIIGKLKIEKKINIWTNGISPYDPRISTEMHEPKPNNLVWVFIDNFKDNKNREELLKGFFPNGNSFGFVKNNKLYKLFDANDSTNVFIPSKKEQLEEFNKSESSIRSFYVMVFENKEKSIAFKMLNEKFSFISVILDYSNNINNEPKIEYIV